MTLEFETVEKHYADGTVALAGVSFTVPKGQLCVVLGPSGAGKSTLLRCVNGLVQPSSGCVRINGVPVNPQSLADIRPTVGMIHQGFNLVGRSSVAMNVIAGALPKVATLPALFGVFPRHYRGKACELVSEVGLSPLCWANPVLSPHRPCVGGFMTLPLRNPDSVTLPVEQRGVDGSRVQSGRTGPSAHPPVTLPKSVRGFRKLQQIDSEFDPKLGTVGDGNDFYIQVVSRLADDFPGPFQQSFVLLLHQQHERGRFGAE